MSMLIKNLLNSKLDISSQETHPDPERAGEDTLHMAIVMRPGQTIEIDDRYSRLRNINEALLKNWIQIISYDDSATSTVVHPEVGGGGDLTHSTLTLNNGETDTVDEVDINTTKTAKWFISVTDATNNTCMSVEVYAHHEGGSATHSTHVKLGSSKVKFDVDVSGGMLRLRATATADTQIINAQRISITI